MGRNDVDGNLAALKAEENQQRKQEKAFAEIMEDIQPLLDQISELAEECHQFDNKGIYDFAEDIAIEIRNMI